MLLHTYATKRPIGTRARSLRVGTPTHVYTVPTAGSPTYARIGRYATVPARPDYTWAHPPTCAPYTAVRLLASARAPVGILRQPLDVSVFGPFKEYLCGFLERLGSPYATNTYEVFDYLRIMTEEYRESFTHQNVVSGFAKRGLWPLNPKSLLSIPCSASSCNSNTLLTVEEMERLMQERRQSDAIFWV